MKIDHTLYKTIGFLNYTNSEIKSIRKELTPNVLDENDRNFLNQTYHSEFLNIMFDNNNAEHLYKDLDYEIEINSISTKLILNKIELFIFHEEDKKDTNEEDKTNNNYEEKN